MKSIGIALIGYGGIGRVHAMAYRDLPYHYALPADAIRIVGVATARLETAEAAAVRSAAPFGRMITARCWRVTWIWPTSASRTPIMRRS